LAQFEEQIRSAEWRSKPGPGAIDGCLASVHSLPSQQSVALPVGN
jgi:hypothetical protein